MARTPDSAALLDAWEAALAEPDPIQAPSLLVSLGWVDTPEALHNSTVGQTDTLLFSLRSQLFGPRLECVCACPTCGQGVEFTVSTSDLMAEEPRARATRVSLLSGRLTCRPPANIDLYEIRNAPEPAGSRQLLRRCALDDAASVADLSEDDCEQALSELAQADTGSCVEIALECPSGHRWVDEFDIRRHLLSDLTDWAARTLRDVHQLASRYGWSESAILRMSPWRKRIYLDACEGGG